jgi:signal transduction histidine kinase
VAGLSPAAEAALYRVAQEALHNALRHAAAAGVRLTLSKTARQVVLEVADDGRGFEGGDTGANRAAAAPSGGLGLDSMRERAAAAGGTLTIRSGAKGTVVRMTVPGRAGR